MKRTLEQAPKRFETYAEHAARVPPFDIAAMAAWARAYAAENEPIVIPDPRTKAPYLLRWHVVPRNDFLNVYLHKFLLSDEDRGLHDHRGPNRSWVLDGAYREYLAAADYTRDGRHVGNGPRRVFTRRAGELVERDARDLHRVELIDGAPVWSLFLIGPKTGEWGFCLPTGERLSPEAFYERFP